MGDYVHVYNFYSLGICLFEIYLYYHFYKSLFPLKPRYKSVSIVFLIISALILNNVNTYNMLVLNMTCSMLIVSAMIIILFEVTNSSVLAYGLTVYSVFFGIEVVFELYYRMAASVTGISSALLFEKTHWLLLVVEQMIRLIYLKSLELYTSKLLIRGNEKFTWLLVIAPFTMIVVLMTFINVEYPTDFLLQLGMCVGATMLYLMSAVIFFILVRFYDALDREKMQELALTKSYAEQHAYKHLEKVSLEYREYAHDMNSYLRTMRSLAEQSKNAEIVTLYQQIEEKERKIRAKTYSSNYILDALIRERVNRAADQQIEFTIEIPPNISVGFIEEIDMISMFGNLLDNALEAAGDCGQGWISMKFFMGNDHFLVLQVKNNYDKPVIKEGNRFITTKTDKASHGFGIANVRKTVRNYGGFLELAQKDGTFTASLFLSIMRDQQN